MTPYLKKTCLLLQIRTKEVFSWKGKLERLLLIWVFTRAPCNKNCPWPRIGGSPDSAIRAGRLGLPLMIAIIGGETRRFKRYVDLYKEAGEKAGHAQKV